MAENEEIVAPGSEPEPDDPRKPDELTDIPRRSWLYVFRRAVREFLDDQCTDLAAALTYYAVLALFPGLLAVIAVFGVVGEGEKSVETMLDVLEPVVDASTLDEIRPVLEGLASSQAAGIALVVGVAAALWSASGYVGAFSRAMNRVYEVEEGRPFWKLRPMQLWVTVVSVALCVLGLTILIVSGPLAQSVGDAIGMGETAVQVWDIAKWPLLLVIVVLVVALLYYATPNVRQPRFRWLSPGAILAILVWVAASAGFAFYVSGFSSYNRTYGSLAGVIVLLLWLWLTNLALLLGAELDAELERGRQLLAGIEAEETLRLPVRDDRGIEKARTRQEAEVARGRELREAATGGGDPADRPYR